MSYWLFIFGTTQIVATVDVFFLSFLTVTGFRFDLITCFHSQVFLVVSCYFFVVTDASHGQKHSNSLQPVMVTEGDSIVGVSERYL